MSKKKKQYRGIVRKILTPQDTEGLHKVAEEVGSTEKNDADSGLVISREIDRIIKDMRQTLFYYKALGLAANQIGHNVRIITIRAGKGAIVIINPVLSDISPVNIPDKESCLSVPYAGEVTLKRPGKVTVSGYGVQGQKINRVFTHFTARVIFHEVDHLNGILITDRKSQ